MSSSDVEKHDLGTKDADEKSIATENRAAESLNTTSGELDKDIEKQNHDAVHDVEVTKTNTEPAAAEVDPNIVDFDGPDDPANPMNWTKKRKWINGGFLSALTFIT